jgi:ABC-type multidrug transport system ATPase subunit
VVVNIKEAAVLVTKGLCKNYGRTPALRNLDLEIRPGEVVALLGANGAGKTTTIKLLLGLIRPSAGEAKVCGFAAGHMQVRGRIGYSPESRRFHEFLTIAETLCYYAELARIERSRRPKEIERAMNLTGLMELRDRKAGKLSKGEAQRLSVAQSLLGDPPILLLDEPTSGLDPVGRIAMRKLLERCGEEGKTVLLNSHILSDVESICGRVLILRKGVLAWQGQISEVVTARQSVEVHAEVLTAEAEASLHADGFTVLRRNSHWEVSPCPASRVPRVAELVVAAGGRIQALIPRGNSLEDLFVELSGGEDNAGHYSTDRA